MATVIGPGDGKAGFLGSIGVRFMIDGEDAGGDFSLVEHPLPPPRPGGAAAPAHPRGRVQLRARRADGRAARRRGGGGRSRRARLQAAQRVAHLLERGEVPCRILEIIAPAGFEHFFEELVDMGGGLNATPEKLADLNDRYALEMKPESVPELLERFGLTIGEPVESALQLA